MNAQQEFNATCSKAIVKETENYLYKICSFGELRYWKKSGRISTAKIKPLKILHKHIKVIKKGADKGNVKLELVFKKEKYAAVFNHGDYSGPEMKRIFIAQLQYQLTLLKKLNKNETNN